MVNNFMGGLKRKRTKTYLRTSSKSKTKEKAKRVPGNNLMDTDYTDSQKTVRKLDA